METLDHRALKRLARSFARSIGCCAIASEVAAPVPRYRVDVAGYGDRFPMRTRKAGGTTGGMRAGGTGERGVALGGMGERGMGEGGMGERSGSPVHEREKPRPFTIIIECKQSRADFLRDTRDREALLRRRLALTAQLTEIENTLLPACEPHLRIPRDAALGPSLFPDLDAWDHARSNLPAYRETIREMARLDKAIYGDTKFCCLAAWRLADLLYVAAPRGMVRAHELPSGWGLIEFTRPSRAGEGRSRLAGAGSLGDPARSVVGAADFSRRGVVDRAHEPSAARAEARGSDSSPPLSPPWERMSSGFADDRRGGRTELASADLALTTIRVACESLNSPDFRRMRLLRNIAVQSCKRGVPARMRVALSSEPRP